ncbi:hypothetical protein BJX68DRAFT_229834 [Aspergillus pseudodeflectus]|uniref:GDP/GTP exchange factor Sec2 N-terminal domain-containing protein n=1 Tax=Aspergillus pseudodeflectus TaxID=176178 RepID=A0ABR4KXG6_9EURO
MATTTTLTSTLVGVNATSFEATCPTCGQSQDHSHPADFSRRRVKDLEGQVHLLNSQAVQMAEKLAEYEEEMRRLRAQSATSALVSRTNASISSTSSGPDALSQSQSPPQQGGRLSSLASLLPYRRPSTANSNPRSQLQTSPPPLSSQSQAPGLSQSPPPQYPRTPEPRPSFEETLELQNALNREQNLRKAAETQLSQASTELEELTAQLFSQANEMVAQERKARARLEERVAVLERRDIEKRNRLERLEKAMERVERIRALVG